MIKTLMTMLAGAIVFAVGAAFATVGTAPLFNTGYQLVDGQWLLGLASGSNYTVQYNIVAHAGGGQSACTPLPPGIAFYSVDTVVSNNDSVCLPFASAGTDIQIANNTAQTLGIYGLSANDPATGVADTINGTAGSSVYSSTTNQHNVECFVAKAGGWRCVAGN